MHGAVIALGSAFAKPLHMVKDMIGASHVVRRVNSASNDRAGKRGGARARSQRVTIERIFADIEIEGRQIDRAEIEQRGEHFFEIKHAVSVMTRRHPTSC